MNKILSFIIFITFSLNASAFSLKAEADSAYAQENYVKAITTYKDVLRMGESPEIYYNLGGAYYKSGDIANAVLCYERALLLSPGDDDIQYNLDLARSKTIDKVVPSSEMFFVTWTRSLIHLRSSDSWAVLGVVCFAITLAMIMLFLMSHSVRVRKISFFSGVACAIISIFSNIFAFNLKAELSKRSGAIVMQSAISVKSTPSDSGTELFVIHSGTRVDILDDTLKKWYEVKLQDGKSGWIPSGSIERI